MIGVGSISQTRAPRTATSNGDCRQGGHLSADQASGQAVGTVDASG